MKLRYTDNPLMTYIELNSFEKRALKLRLLANFYEDTISETLSLIHFPKVGPPNIHQMIEILSKSYEDNAAKKYVEHWYSIWIDELECLEHGGDCTAFACSCGRCRAERFVGIDTLTFNKSIGSVFSNAFHLTGMSDTSGKEVIEYLKKPLVWDTAAVSHGWKDRKQFEFYIPKFTETRNKAIEILEKHLAEKAGKTIEIEGEENFYEY